MKELDEGSRQESSPETFDNEPDVDDQDGPWYMGKAREEFYRRRGGQMARREEEEDPIQV